MEPRVAIKNTLTTEVCAEINFERQCACSPIKVWRDAVRSALKRRRDGMPSMIDRVKRDRVRREAKREVDRDSEESQDSREEDDEFWSMAKDEDIKPGPSKRSSGSLVAQRPARSLHAKQGKL